jgi:hypothetical protein
MFTDKHRATVWDEIRQRDLRAFAKLLPASVFVEAATQAGLAVGSSALCLPTLVWLGLSAALRTSLDFATVLKQTLQLLRDTPTWSADPLAKMGSPRPKGGHRPKRKQKKSNRCRRSKHDPRRENPSQISESAFTQARQRMPWEFWAALLVVLGRRFEEQHGDATRWKGFRLLALDGTCVQLPNWQPLTAVFGTAKNGKAVQTQARLVMLQLPRVRLPWRYELTPLAQGEHTVAKRLLTQLQPNDLVLMDRGFFSYGLFWQIQRQQSYFVIRKCRSVKLKTLRRLGPNDRLVRWTPAHSRWRTGEWPPAMTLRLIDYHIQGFRPNQVVTNVTNPRQMTRDDCVRLSTDASAQRRLDPGLYHQRWQIETTFLELKVRQGMEGHLRSRSPEGIRYEVAGHVLCYFLIRWLMVEAAEKAGTDPLRLSFLGALRELSTMAPLLIIWSMEHVRRILLPRLLERIAAHLVPLRPGRHYPRPHDTKPRTDGNGCVRLPSKLPPAA